MVPAGGQREDIIERDVAGKAGFEMFRQSLGTIRLESIRCGSRLGEMRPATGALVSNRTRDDRIRVYSVRVTVAVRYVRLRAH
jgi:hypothetical protein